MELFVIRHAIAADARREQRDEERALTENGRERFEKAVEGLASLDVRLGCVLHSPWRRAAETAELLRPITDGPLEPTLELAKAPGEALVRKLARLAEKRPLAVVGHQPWLGELVLLLTTGDVEHGDVIDLKKGGVVWLEGEPAKGAMRILAYLPPRVLRSIRARPKR